ncbi:U1 small nuclear ribonucleoprotein, putative [Leishmania donovani]|uniref:U1 small nuclear ribonucleoprotein, putative n=1 Tax=Leishmania donovani TaxID=5661 RepID=E9BD20_LEIDO|nr:U1 small nuclear ribonucleoprotein, putative [Leishmania donovani]CBZ33146.1 U1 small nuclear ribonucleoprotein, putative [Leishmania donovani]
MRGCVERQVLTSRGTPRIGPRRCIHDKLTCVCTPLRAHRGRVRNPIGLPLSPLVHLQRCTKQNEHETPRTAATTHPLHTHTHISLPIYILWSVMKKRRDCSAKGWRRISGRRCMPRGSALSFRRGRRRLRLVDCTDASRESPKATRATMPSIPHWRWRSRRMRTSPLLMPR